MPPISLEALEGLIGRLVTLGLVHSGWIGLLVAAVAAIAFQTLPLRSHRIRHALLIVAIALVAFGPMGAVAIQRSFVAPKPLDADVSIRVETNRPPTDQALTDHPHPQPPASKQHGSVEVSIHVGRMLMATDHCLEMMQPYALAAWLIGAGILSARLILGGFAIRRLIRNSRPACETIQARADDLAHRVKLGKIPRVLIHPELAEPGLCGLFRPKILLPERWLDHAERNRIDAILAHELAHAKRLDLPANLAQRLVEIALFFHPAIHWLSRSLRRERELCADALAITVTGDPIALASTLESVARLRLAYPSTCRRRPTFGASLGGENLSLLPRIQELLGMTPSHSARRSVWPWASLPTAGLVALLSASLGLANDPSKAVDAALKPTSKAAPSPNPTPSPTTSKTPIPVTKPDAKPLVATPPTDTESMVSLEVRFVSVAEPAWRNANKEGLREVYRDGEVTSWIVRDQEATQDLVISLQEPAGSRVLQAPKVTTYEGAKAFIYDPKKGVENLAGQKPGQGTARINHPAGISGGSGMGVGLTPMIRAAAVSLSVDLFTSIEDKAAADKGFQKIKAGPSKDHLVLVNHVPTGSSLLIRPESSKSPNEEAGRPALERMVLITPKAFPKTSNPKKASNSIEVHGALNGRIVGVSNP